MRFEVGDKIKFKWGKGHMVGTLSKYIGEDYWWVLFTDGCFDRCIEMRGYMFSHANPVTYMRRKREG